MINFSELLWKPDRIGRRASLVSSSEALESFDNASELNGVLVQQVILDPSVRVVLKSDPQGPGSDRFRFLRMRLRELKNLAKLQSIVITSPLPEDGKSTIALNLATALADEGKSSVLLIEADLYHPSLGKCLGINVEGGLVDCLEDGADPFSALRRIEPLGWYLLPAGIARRNPTEILQSDSLPILLQKFKAHFDWVLIDTPPITPLTDAVALSRHVDATLLVIRAGRTPRDAIEAGIELIGRKHILGIIFNGAESLNRLYSKYYGHYTSK
jgi:succinoglycan biosynthesis transport protein ExoP